jgi:hypothetical protein
MGMLLDIWGMICICFILVMIGYIPYCMGKLYCVRLQIKITEEKTKYMQVTKYKERIKRELGIK